MKARNKQGPAATAAHLLPIAIELAKDRVPNIRYQKNFICVCVCDTRIHNSFSFCFLSCFLSVTRASLLLFLVFFFLFFLDLFLRPSLHLSLSFTLILTHSDCEENVAAVGCICRFNVAKLFAQVIPTTPVTMVQSYLKPCLLQLEQVRLVWVFRVCVP